MKPETPSALEQAIALLLRPLFRLLLRQGMAFTAFEKLAKRVYVDLAFHEFGLPGKKPSISRTSILSGLTRKDVQRLLAEPDARGAPADAGYNRAARVLTGWVRDADFADAMADPRPLDADGEHGFARLVRRYSGDMPVRAVLDELLRVGAVQRLADGRIALCARAYVPAQDDDEKLHILGTDVADLVATIDHNLQHGGSDARFQRKVMYRGIAPQALPAFRKLGAAQAQALLERLDRWLAAQLDAQPPADPGGAQARVGLGIYYFEQMLEPHEVPAGADR
ncbi:MAG TPA: DUF6502 family protein [Rubrivivax sp.]|nr:DUF6502 family protein [Rubrivivax sp.]